MAELDTSPAPVLGPFSPTYMPYFRPHRSPSSSSNNTRQRDDYEQCLVPSPAPVSPQVMVTGTDEEDDEEAAHAKPEHFAESYPAWELPFASEPALDGELEQGLPPLKKLKSGSDEDRSYFDEHSDSIVIIGAVKGILTRRDGGAGSTGHTTPVQVSSPSGATLQPNYSSWPGPLALAGATLSVHANTSRPLSRRSSSGASSACTRASFKAVRFASGNGFMSCWGGGEASGDGAAGVGEFEGPVAAVMYLTHSADAYDRSPIVVEAGLRLPPRAKKEDGEGGGWVKCTEVETLGRNAKASGAKSRLAKVSAETIRPNRLQLCTSPTNTHEEGDQVASSASNHEDETPETSVVENSVVIREPLRMSPRYREAEQEDEEEDDDVSTAEAVDDDEEPDLGMRRSGSEDDEAGSSGDEEEENGIGGSGSAGERWSFGGWSNGEVFGCCDALGGF